MVGVWWTSITVIDNAASASSRRGFILKVFGNLLAARRKKPTRNRVVPLLPIRSIRLGIFLNDEISLQ
jgi:hypothetical protein